MDDDNEWDPRLWSALRQLGERRVGALAVQLSANGKVERPLYDALGHFKQFQGGWCYDSWLALLNGPRLFCVDMGAFAFDAALLHGKREPLWQFAGRHNLLLPTSSRLGRSPSGYTASGGATWRGGESEFVSSLVRYPEDLQPLANCGRDVLVYHNGFASADQSKNRPWRGRAAAQQARASCKMDGW
jgi:hypothetical protein